MTAKGTEADAGRDGVGLFMARPLTEASDKD